MESNPACSAARPRARTSAQRGTWPLLPSIQGVRKRPTFSGRMVGIQLISRWSSAAPQFKHAGKIRERVNDEVGNRFFSCPNGFAGAHQDTGHAETLRRREVVE